MEHKADISSWQAHLGSAFYGKTKKNLYEAPNQFFNLMMHSCESNGKVLKFKLHDTVDVKTSENLNKCL